MTWTSATSGDVGRAKSTPHAFCVHPALVLITCILASSLAFVDGSVVNVGLPAIGHSLRADAADLQWVINAYLLPLSALLLTGGALGDRLGRRSILIFGIVLFGAASALCAAAPNLGWLLAARALQGTGAALLLPNSLAILGAAFTGEARGRAVGTWSAASAMAAAFGPVLGGWLIDEFGWREIFLINIPLACVGGWMAVRFVPKLERGEETPIDLRGAILATLALAAITWGLTLGAGRAGWSDWAVLSIIAGVGLVGAFLWNERAETDKAMMPLALFETADFIGLTLLTLLLYGALGALLVLVPYVLIQGAGYSGTAAGAALLPFPIILAATSRAMGGIAGRLGSRIPLTLGPMIVAIGFLLLLRVNASANYWTGLFPAIVTMSIGMAGAVAPLTTAVLASVDARHTGSASGLNSAVARTGGLVATALLGGVLAATGEHLFSTFHQAATACAIACVAAGVAAFLLLPTRTRA
ncbi:MAG TPA: MFS transporter [Rhizomicrobium sp.]|jgi:EmrB/QacA subfamily drug resistance transporter|nr:MFS transporter [Rhizomicrobium sp.]